MRRSIAILLFVLCAGILFAGYYGDEGYETGGIGYFMTGWGMANFDNLNSFLKLNALPEIEESHITSGGAGFGIVNNFIIGGGGYGFSESEFTSGDYKVKYSGGYGFFNLGYIVYSIKGIRIYPLLGVGGGSVAVSFTPTSMPSSFDSAWANPISTAEISNSAFMLDFSVGAHYLIRFKRYYEEGGGGGGILVGLRAGYSLAPYKGDWILNGNKLSGGPNVNLSGPYIAITIGGGGGTTSGW